MGETELFDRGFDEGGVAALKLLRVELLNAREPIENDDNMFDAIVELVEMLIAKLENDRVTA